MVTTVHSTNTVAFPTDKRSKGSKNVLLPKHYPELRAQLTNLLQTTLELPKVLEIFFNTVQHHLSINSMHYRYSKLLTNVELGKSSRHNCHYKLATQEDMLGDLSFSRSQPFEEKELQLLEQLISCLICPMRNALLYREALQSALRDSLTGAGNRLALENTLEREISLAYRHKLPLSILVVDIDKFKQINDTYGHTAGDCVLKDVVKLLSQGCRETDSAYRAFRLGGEEFVLILNNTSTDGAIIAAERIRHHVEGMSTSYDGNAIRVTVSVGVATLLEGENMSMLFSRADKALYEAKNNGRNQVINALTLLQEPSDISTKR